MKYYGRLDMNISDAATRFQVIRTNGNKSRFLVVDFVDSAVEDWEKEDLLRIAKKKKILGVDKDIITPLGYIACIGYADGTIETSLADDKAFKTEKEAEEYLYSEDGLLFKYLLEGFNDGSYDYLECTETEDDGFIFSISLKDFSAIACLSAEDVVEMYTPDYVGERGGDELSPTKAAIFMKKLIEDDDYLKLYTSRKLDTFLDMLINYTSTFDDISFYICPLFKSIV